MLLTFCEDGSILEDFALKRVYFEMLRYLYINCIILVRMKFK